jgi:hypothetical protein
MNIETDRIATRASAVEDKRSAYDGNKLPFEIEEAIVLTRRRLNDTIEALERELVPRRIIENGAEALRCSLEPRPGPFRDQVWAYAIPLALIVTGLGWLFMLRRHSWQADHQYRTRGEAVGVEETSAPTPLCSTIIDLVEPVPPVDVKTAI